jgi:hypothetical protein
MPKTRQIVKIAEIFRDGYPLSILKLFKVNICRNGKKALDNGFLNLKNS